MATTLHNNNIGLNVTPIPNDVTTTWCDHSITDIPHTPINLTVLGIFTTSVILQWAMSCDQPSTGQSASFEVHVDPSTSDWMSDHDLLSFVVTRIHGDTRQYKLKPLVPETIYNVYILAVSSYGISNKSDTVTFKTRKATVTNYPSIKVRPIEAVLVFGILSAWFLTIVWFLKKWATLRILHPSEYRYTNTPPKNLDTIKVVRTEDDSVIYRNYGKDYHRTMQARQKRLDRMQTMPNLNVQLTDSPKSTNIKSKLSKSLEECSTITGNKTAPGVIFKPFSPKNPESSAIRKGAPLEIFPEENSEQCAEAGDDVCSTTV